MPTEASLSCTYAKPAHTNTIPAGKNTISVWTNMISAGKNTISEWTNIIPAGKNTISVGADIIPAGKSIFHGWVNIIPAGANMISAYGTMTSVCASFFPFSAIISPLAPGGIPVKVSKVSDKHSSQWTKINIHTILIQRRQTC
jgi:hypothetical protein